MSNVRVQHRGVTDLVKDLESGAVEAATGFVKATGNAARAGARLAKISARKTAGAHGKHYPSAISAQTITPTRWEFGPESDKRQGGMSFEFGSRNQKPHLDLNRAADVVVIDWYRDIDDVLDSVFW